MFAQIDEDRILEEAELQKGHPLAVEDLAAGIDRRGPVDRNVGVPLVALGLRVELLEAGLLELVGPVPHGVDWGAHLLEGHGALIRWTAPSGHHRVVRARA